MPAWAVLIAGIIVLLTLKDTRCGIVAVLASTMFSPEFEAGSVPKIRFDDIAILVMVLTWLARKSVGGVTARRTPLHGTMVALLLWSLLPTLLAVSGRVHWGGGAAATKRRCMRSSRG